MTASAAAAPSEVADLVSVVIPAFNSGPLLDETLASVFAQSHRHVEIIVVDDGSTDDTPARLLAHGSRLRVIRRPNGGEGAALNTGIAACRGDHVAILNHDDLWTPDKLAVQLALLRQHPDAGLAICDGVEIDNPVANRTQLVFGPTARRLRRSDRRFIRGRLYRTFLMGNPTSTPSQTLIPRRVLAAVGPMLEGYADAEDFDLILRIARSFPVVVHGDSLCRWRYVATSVSGVEAGRRLVWARREIEVLRRHALACSAADRPWVRLAQARLAARIARFRLAGAWR